MSPSIVVIGTICRRFWDGKEKPEISGKGRGREMCDSCASPAWQCPNNLIIFRRSIPGVLSLFIDLVMVGIDIKTALEHLLIDYVVESS